MLWKGWALIITTVIIIIFIKLQSCVLAYEYTQNLYEQKLAQFLGVAQVSLAVTRQYYELCSKACVHTIFVKDKSHDHEIV